MTRTDSQWGRTLGVALMLQALACGNSASGDLPPPACDVDIQEVAYEGAQHVPVDMPLSYGSNPPASGMHYPYWGTWGVHDTPLPRGNYVHNMEHGGVALLYRCDGGCPDIVAALRGVMDGQPQDSSCSAPVRNRIVVTADSLLDVPVAAAAWRFTYRAACVDAPSLAAFISAHYDRGPESLCAQGQIQ